MKNLKPWRLYIGIFAVFLILISFLIDLKIGRSVKEVSINNFEIVSDAVGPVISFDLVNLGDRVQHIKGMEVSLNNAMGMNLDRVKLNESVMIEPGKKRRIEMTWAGAIGVKGWLWTNIKLEDTKAYQQLSWLWPKIDLTSPTSLLALSPVVFWFVMRKSFFT